MSRDDHARPDYRELCLRFARLEDERRRAAMSLRDAGGLDPAAREEWERLDEEVAHARAQLGMPPEAKPRTSGRARRMTLAGSLAGVLALGLFLASR